jgi:hypothetical protein
MTKRERETRKRVEYQQTKDVQMLVNFLGLAVLAEETTENAHAADPDDLLGEASLAGTSSLTSASVSTLSLGLETLVNTSTGVDGVGLLDDVTILDQLAEVLTCRLQSCGKWPTQQRTHPKPQKDHPARWPTHTRKEEQEKKTRNDKMNQNDYAQ